MDMFVFFIQSDMQVDHGKVKPKKHGTKGVFVYKAPLSSTNSGHELNNDSSPDLPLKSKWTM